MRLASFTSGSGASFGGCSDQNSRSSLVIGPLRKLEAVFASAGHGAPRLIHSARSAIAAAGNFFSGILRSPSCFTAFSSKLAPASARLTAAPRSPPASIISR